MRRQKKKPTETLSCTPRPRTNSFVCNICINRRRYKLKRQASFLVVSSVFNWDFSHSLFSLFFLFFPLSIVYSSLSLFSLMMWSPFRSFFFLAERKRREIRKRNKTKYSNRTIHKNPYRYQVEEQQMSRHPYRKRIQLDRE